MWQKNPVGADEVRKEYAGRHGAASLQEGQYREREDRHAGRRGSDRKNIGRRAWRWSGLYFALRFVQEVSEVEHDA